MKKLLLLLLILAVSLQAEKLKVCATVSDLADIISTIGGEHVSVETFTPAMSNPHSVIAKPNFIKDLSQADLYLQIGFDLEIGWAPGLLKNCRNSKIQAGADGHFDSSKFITPLFEKQGILTRADGHVHTKGNPHYLLDPVNGLIIAHALFKKLKELRPEQTTYFEQNLQKFEKELLTKLIGQQLLDKYEINKLSQLIRVNKLDEFLELSKQQALLGGWLGEFKKLSHKNFIADHSSYIYFAKRFDLNVVDYLEPKPGMEPTVGHLKKLYEELPSQNIKGILTHSYFPAKYAQMVSQKINAPILNIAHQVGSCEGCDCYLHTIEHNVNQILTSLKK